MWPCANTPDPAEWLIIRFNGERAVWNIMHNERLSIRCSYCSTRGSDLPAGFKKPYINFLAKKIQKFLTLHLPWQFSWRLEIYPARTLFKVKHLMHCGPNFWYFKHLVGSFMEDTLTLLRSEFLRKKNRVMDFTPPARWKCVKIYAQSDLHFGERERAVDLLWIFKVYALDELRTFGVGLDLCNFSQI